MIIFSLVLVIVAAVSLVLGIFQDGLELIYVSIGTCVAAMLVLGAGMLLRRRDPATSAPAGYGPGERVSAPVATSRASGTSEALAGRSEGLTSTDPVPVATDTTEGEAAAPVGDPEPASADAGAGSPDPSRDAAATDDAHVVVAPVASDGAEDRDASVAAPAVAGDAEAAPADDQTDVTIVRTTSRPTEPVAAEEPVPAVEDGAAAPPVEDDAVAVPPQPARATTKRAAAKKVAAKKATAKKVAAKKVPAKKAAAKKVAAKKVAAKKVAGKKVAAKKATAKKVAAKKATAPAASSTASLAGIKGLGPAKRAALLARFGDEAGVAVATVEEITTVPGIGAGLARTVKEHLGG